MSLAAEGSGDHAEVAPPVDATRHGLIANGVSRSFGNVHAVVNIDLYAPAGEVTALIGPNGAGKTTLMLMLASLLAPDAGSISVMGIDPSKDPMAARARLGWMPDTLGVWESLTAREILTTMAKLYQLPKEAIPGRVSELLALVKLGDLADQKARVLSRGQQQRLSLARALIHDPDVLLLDEPASGLDPGSRVDLRLILRSLAERGKAILISSHVLSELDEIADRAVFVTAGRSVLAQSVDQATAQGRRYAISSLDHVLLLSTLTRLGLTPTEDSTRRAQAVVVVGNESDAARLLADLVSNGVPISAFAPAAGALEEAYLTMEAGRLQ